MKYLNIRDKKHNAKNKHKSIFKNANIYIIVLRAKKQSRGQ